MTLSVAETVPEAIVFEGGLKSVEEEVPWVESEERDGWEFVEGWYSWLLGYCATFVALLEV